MPTLTEIAKALGITQPRVTQLSHKGMPINSVKAAKAWREKQGVKRAATNAKEQLAKKKGRPKIARKPSKTGDSLLDALNNAIFVADRAFEEYELACVSNWSTRSQRLSEHNKALDGRLKAEKAYREEQERRKILVPKQEALELARRSIDAVLRRLKKLPQESGPQCNELEPLKSVAILQRAVDEILLTGANAIRDLNK